MLILSFYRLLKKKKKEVKRDLVGVERRRIEEMKMTLSMIQMKEEVMQQMEKNESKEERKNEESESVIKKVAAVEVKVKIKNQRKKEKQRKRSLKKNPFERAKVL